MGFGRAVGGLLLAALICPGEKVSKLIYLNLIIK